jgi:hypothetical protein
VVPQMLPLNIENLNLLGRRLYDHADSITNVARHDMEVDVRTAARAVNNLASLRFQVAEIAEMALNGQHGAATYRDLNAALADAEV